MEINMNGSIGSGRMAFDVTQVSGVNVSGNDAVSSSAEKKRNCFDLKPAALDILHGSEPIAEVPDDALVRDDALGNLVKVAFNLPPPPMPTFAE